MSENSFDGKNVEEIPLRFVLSTNYFEYLIYMTVLRVGWGKIIRDDSEMQKKMKNATFFLSTAVVVC
jgi:hypothetical protein